VDLFGKPLDATTWPDFAQLAEDHRGVWAGCWCLNFHPEGRPQVHSPEQRRELKEARVRRGEAHAALVYDEGLGELPDWRITCFFVGSTHRGRGVADAALAGAIEEIGRLGGGLVESYPEEVAGRKVSGPFLYNATVALFERHGFERTRQIGKHHWVVRLLVGRAG